jgi:hypothetical protein
VERENLIAVKKTLTPWGVVGYLALAATAVGILVSLKDIKRYIRISTM